MHKAVVFFALVVVALAQNIRRGSSGPDVVAIQFLLRHRGQANVVTDGQFNAATRDAVIAFQRSAGLTADGVVNSNTIAALGPVLRSGAVGEAVRAAQYLLRTKFGAGISVNGQFNAIIVSTIEVVVPAIFCRSTNQDWELPKVYTPIGTYNNGIDMPREPINPALDPPPYRSPFWPVNPTHEWETEPSQNWTYSD